MKTTMQMTGSIHSHLPRSGWVPLLTVLILLAFNLSAAAQNTHLRLEFADRAGDKLSSDGNGAYVSGAKGGLQAVITSDGRFSFVSGTQRKAHVDLSPCLNLGDYLVQVFQIGPPVDNLNNLATGQSMKIELNVNVFVGDKAKTTWQVRFTIGSCGIDNRALVTRTGLNTWELETPTDMPACGGCANNFFPFKLYLTRK